MAAGVVGSSEGLGAEACADWRESVSVSSELRAAARAAAATMHTRLPVWNISAVEFPHRCLLLAGRGRGTQVTTGLRPYPLGRVLEALFPVQLRAFSALPSVGKPKQTLPSSLSLHSAPLKTKSFSQRTLRPPKPPWVSSYTRVCVHPSRLHCFGLVLCSASCLRLVGPASGHLELSALFLPAQLLCTFSIKEMMEMGPCGPCWAPTPALQGLRATLGHTWQP